QPAGNPAAGEIAEAGDDERDPGVFADGGHVEVAGVLQVFRKPEDVEIPDRVHENLREEKGPDEADSQELPDAERFRRGGRGDFFFWWRIRRPVDRPPE